MSSIFQSIIIYFTSDLSPFLICVKHFEILRENLLLSEILIRVDNMQYLESILLKTPLLLCGGK